jgi:NADH dehydrogenase
MAQVLDRQADLEQDRGRPARARPNGPRLRGERLLPYVYRDFGSLVSLGRHTTVGSMMGFLFGRGMFIEGLFARAMYHSLRLMQERTLNGTSYDAVLGLLSRALSRRTGPPVK